MDYLKNISLNLRATGPAAVLIVWLVCITAVGLFGDCGLARAAFAALAIAGGVILMAFTQKLTEFAKGDED